ncbi:PH domain-like protein [Ascobolus immersus RN42]|uniref:PH domain-like protein n=1 Tax=Ascobolus immersus RN42 TaxID=1160509 RepID=A0A3N4IF57_ASCIM|nr:PH domain-like protein [Ascobolus immersus RN42]
MHAYPSSLSSTNSSPSSSTTSLQHYEMLPPSYYEIDADIRLPPPRFPIAPRPEEGCEALPTYTSSIFKEALFDVKFEMSSPFEKAHDRSWRSVYTVLNGTALNIYRPKRTTVLGNLGPGQSANSVKGFAPGHLLKTYTLQGAEIGLADDYHKRPHVVRVRAEKDQFLLAMGSLATMMDWLESLSSAIDLAPALEERQLPRYQTIPRRRHHHHTTLQMVSEQEAIMRQQFPHLLQPDDSHRSSPTGSTVDVPDESTVPNPHNHQNIAAHENDLDLAAFRGHRQASQPTTPRASSELIQSTSGELTRRSSVSSTCSQEEEAEEIKAIQPHRISEQANLRYAKRCMPNLPANAPRQSDFLITGDGKRWKIDWDHKQLIEWRGRPDTLPAYEDAVFGRSTAEGLA